MPTSLCSLPGATDVRTLARIDVNPAYRRTR